MSTAVRVDCANARSAHFATLGEAEAEVLTRKINDARSRRSGGVIRHVEPCAACDMWMIVSPVQQANRRSAPAPRRGR